MITVHSEHQTTVDSTMAVRETLRGELPLDWQRPPFQPGLRTQGTSRPSPAPAPGSERQGRLREPASMARQRNRDVNEAYTRDIEALMSSSSSSMIATHDLAVVSCRARQRPA